MLRNRALKRILVTTIALFIFITVYVIKHILQSDVLQTNMEFEYVTGLGTNDIYLLNKDNLLVKNKILITDNSKEKQIETILNNLIEGNTHSYPSEFQGTIPSKTKILAINYDEGFVTINFSREFLKLAKDTEEKTIESIVYSIFSLKNIDGIYIQVEGNILDKYPISNNKISYPLTKSIGINKHYDLNNRNDINKVVVYYFDDINNDNYYVPVTKYFNDSNDKIKVIIDLLTSSYIYEPNLMSFLNNNVELKNYNIEEGVFFLDFNDRLYDYKNKILEEVLYSISYSVFDNYDVDKIVFRVDGNDVETVSSSDLY